MQDSWASILFCKNETVNSTFMLWWFQQVCLPVANKINTKRSKHMLTFVITTGIVLPYLTLKQETFKHRNIEFLYMLSFLTTHVLRVFDLI